MTEAISAPAPFEMKYNVTFSRHQQTRLYELQQSSSLTDFTIRVGEHSLTCHKVVLAAVCPYFDAMLRTGLEEAENEEVNLDCLEWDVVKEIVKYCYIGDLKLEYRNLKNLIIACDFLQLLALKSMCEKHVIQELKIDNCIGWYKVSTLYNMEELSKASQDMMCAQFTEVCESEEFKELSLAEIIDYIGNDKIDVHSEDAMLSACIDWVISDVDSRKSVFSDLLQHITLKDCSAAFLDRSSERHKELVDTDAVQLHWNAAYKALALAHEETDAGPIGRTLHANQEKCLILFGGQRQIDANAKCMYFCNNKWQNCSEVPDMYNQKDSSICHIREGILVTGGEQDNSSDKCHLYTFHTKSWSTLPNMTTARQAHGSLVAGRFAYVFGGHKDCSVLTSMEALCLETKRWQRMKPMLHTVCFPIATALDMKLFLILDDSICNSDVKMKHGITVQIYDTVKNKWSFGSKLPDNASDTCGASAASFNDAVYVVGGSGKLCNRYTPDTDTWQTLTKPDNIHVYGAALVLEDKIYILGGSTDSTDYETTVSDTVSKYNVEDDSWSTSDFKCPFPIRDHFIMSATLSFVQ